MSRPIGAERTRRLVTESTLFVEEVHSLLSKMRQPAKSLVQLGRATQGGAA